MTQNIFLNFFTKLKTNHLSYSISIELADHREHTEATKPYALVSGFTQLKLTGSDGRSKKRSDIQSSTKTQKMTSFPE